MREVLRVAAVLVVTTGVAEGLRRIIRNEINVCKNWEQQLVAAGTRSSDVGVTETKYSPAK